MRASVSISLIITGLLASTGMAVAQQDTRPPPGPFVAAQNKPAIDSAPVPGLYPPAGFDPLKVAKPVGSSSTETGKASKRKEQKPANQKPATKPDYAPENAAVLPVEALIKQKPAAEKAGQKAAEAPVKKAPEYAPQGAAKIVAEPKADKGNPAEKKPALPVEKKAVTDSAKKPAYVPEGAAEANEKTAGETKTGEASKSGAAETGAPKAGMAKTTPLPDYAPENTAKIKADEGGENVAGKKTNIDDKPDASVKKPAASTKAAPDVGEMKAKDATKSKPLPTYAPENTAAFPNPDAKKAAVKKDDANSAGKGKTAIKPSIEIVVPSANTAKAVKPKASSVAPKQSPVAPQRFANPSYVPQGIVPRWAPRPQWPGYAYRPGYGQPYRPGYGQPYGYRPGYGQPQPYGYGAAPQAPGAYGQWPNNGYRGPQGGYRAPAPRYWYPNPQRQWPPYYQPYRQPFWPPSQYYQQRNVQPFQPRQFGQPGANYGAPAPRR